MINQDILLKIKWVKKRKNMTNKQGNIAWIDRWFMKLGISQPTVMAL